VTVVNESNFLVPNGTFLVELAVDALLFTLLVLWPLLGAVIRRQWGWLILIVFFGPFAGVPWFFMARSAPKPAGEASAARV
jgi:hypothetical protein